jgi:hypothetical protein
MWDALIMKAPGERPKERITSYQYKSLIKQETHQW